MFGFSTADWIFCGLILVVIFVCVAISDMRKPKKPQIPFLIQDGKNLEDSDFHNEQELRRPLGITMLSGLYLFFFMLTASSYGQPIPFMGSICNGQMARLLVLIDSLVCLYLFLGLMKRQTLTWYFLLCYNTFEVLNTLINLFFITPKELEKFIGDKVDPAGLFASNIMVVLAILLLSFFIFHQRSSFTNRSKYLF